MRIYGFPDTNFYLFIVNFKKSEEVKEKRESLKEIKSNLAKMGNVVSAKELKAKIQRLTEQIEKKERKLGLYKKTFIASLHAPIILSIVGDSRPLSRIIRVHRPLLWSCSRMNLR